MSVLSERSVNAIVPAADLQRARSFYADLLGLTVESYGERGFFSHTPERGRASSSILARTAGPPSTLWQAGQLTTWRAPCSNEP